jgi:hypothetical protein
LRIFFLNLKRVQYNPLKHAQSSKMVILNTNAQSLNTNAYKWKIHPPTNRKLNHNLHPDALIGHWYVNYHRYKGVNINNNAELVLMHVDNSAAYLKQKT